MAQELFGFDEKVRPKDHAATHFAKRVEPVSPMHRVELLTACGLRLPLSDLVNQVTPRRCDACLRSLRAMAR